MALGSLGVYFFLFIGLYFEVFLLLSFFEKRPAKKTAARPARYPSVAVIIPCWNEEKTIASTIRSLLALDYPKKKLSVIVVNDGSTDGTLAAARRFEKNPQVQVLTKENGGKHTALNLGIANTDAELIGCLDADSFVTEDALIETVKAFEENPNTMAVIPAMKVHRPRRPLELMQAVEYTFGIFIKRMLGNLGAISVLPGPFSIYRREVFDKVGAFRRAHQTEDMEMAFRLHTHGLHIENAHNAVVYTKVPKTVRALVKQRTRWSQGFLQNSQDYRHMILNRRFGYFGNLVLPFGLVAFVGALYTAGYLLWRLSSALVTHYLDMRATHIPFHFSAPHLDWFYFNTSVIVFLSIAMLASTLFTIMVGRRIAGASFGPWSLLAYFTLYGLVAPLWLARAMWGTLRAQESAWR